MSSEKLQDKKWIFLRDYNRPGKHKVNIMSVYRYTNWYSNTLDACCIEVQVQIFGNAITARDNRSLSFDAARY